IPLAPPVTMATLFFSLSISVFNFYRRLYYDFSIDELHFHVVVNIPVKLLPPSFFILQCCDESIGQ
ncbi:MAG TPA: hypothetical protein PLE32_22120, partial [Haliscomenobacter sp.]|nr:hypothetical protein [Haliscomenobacter sp.]